MQTSTINYWRSRWPLCIINLCQFGVGHALAHCHPLSGSHFFGRSYRSLAVASLRSGALFCVRPRRPSVCLSPSHSVCECDAAAALCCINLFHVEHSMQDSAFKVGKGRLYRKLFCFERITFTECLWWMSHRKWNNGLNGLHCTGQCSQWELPSVR